MKRILILLSTYNGAPFIREQLDSILRQTGVEIKLLIRDDGSSDDTIKIISDYISLYPEKIELILGENIGWKKSFFELVKAANEKYSDFDYYAFSDQDDIWLEEKLITAVNCLTTLSTSVSLYCSNQYYYKDNKIFGLIHKQIYLPTPKNCIVRNFATGCTLVFTPGLLKLVTQNLPSYDVAHDFWFYQVSTLCGKTYYDSNSYILYRQHDNNQIGHKSGWRESWKRRFHNIKSIMLDHKGEKQAQELLNQYGLYMTKEGLEAVKKVATYKSNFSNYLSLLRDRDYSMSSRSNNFWLKVKILLRIY